MFSIFAVFTGSNLHKSSMLVFRSRDLVGSYAGGLDDTGELLSRDRWSARANFLQLAELLQLALGR